MKNHLALTGFCLLVMGAQAMDADWTSQPVDPDVIKMVSYLNKVPGDPCVHSRFSEYIDGELLTPDSCGRRGLGDFLYATCADVKEFENTACGKNAINVLPKSEAAKESRPSESNVIDALTDHVLNPQKINVKYIICQINDNYKQRILKKVTDKPEVITFCREYEAKRAK